MKIDRADDKIVVVGLPNRDDAQRCELVPGARHNRDGWSWPLTLSSCYALREAFGHSLAVGRALNEWARDAIESETTMGELAGWTDAELFNVGALAPSMEAAMASRTYQRVAAAFIADGGNVLVSDQQGLGKTLEVLAGITERGTAGGRHLILAPSVAVVAVWPGEIAHRMGPSSTLVAPITGTGTERRAHLAEILAAPVPKLGTYVIANIEMCRIRPHLTADGRRHFKTKLDSYEDPDTGKVKESGPWFPELFEIEWDTVVVDESQRALIRTGRTPTQTRAGFNKLRTKHKLATSGTPMRGKANQLWGTLNWLRPDLYKGYWQWVETYWNVESNGYSDYVIGDFQPDGLERLAADLRTISIRRTKAEVLPELPPKQYTGTYLIPGDEQSPHGIWLPSTPEQDRQVAAVEGDGILRFKGEGEIICNGHLAKRTRRLQIANAPINADGNPRVVAGKCPKFDWLLEKYDEVDTKIVVASWSTRFLNAISRELANQGIGAFLLTGDTPPGRRKGMIETFQSDEDEIRLFLLNAKAGGVAVTLDAADDLVLMDESTIPDEREQVEDRLHRASRIHQVTIHQLRTLGTVEEEVAWLAAAREDVQKYILDGSRGVDVARQIYVDKKRAKH